nr:MAG TPA: hypothetical protein [Caudoviricetes sp.]
MDAGTQFNVRGVFRICANIRRRLRRIYRMRYMIAQVPSIDRREICGISFCLQSASFQRAHDSILEFIQNQFAVIDDFNLHICTMSVKPFKFVFGAVNQFVVRISLNNAKYPIFCLALIY